MRATRTRQIRQTDIAPAAALMGEPARALMLEALFDRRPLAAGELARLAGVTPATASAHLARLLDGGLVTVVRQGRHRYYQLAGHQVADAIEALAHLGRPTEIHSLRQSREAEALAVARTCYDHLAGRAGVALLDALLTRRLLEPSGGALEPSCGALEPSGGALEPSGGAAGAGPSPARDGDAPQIRMRRASFHVTPAGEEAFSRFGLDIAALRKRRRRFAGACLDWTQRRPHLNGALAAAITSRLLDRRWIEMGTRRRAVRVTSQGREGLAAAFGWDDTMD